jgi:hypothetical protein
MTHFQLDQCFDSKRFVRECAREGFCEVARLPAELRNAEDPELLSQLMVADRPLLTFESTCSRTIRKDTERKYCRFLRSRCARR